MNNPRKALQTQFSVRANDLAESFRATVGRMRVGPHGFAPDMTAPEGPSTGGGVQALQHLRLLPPHPNMPTLVIGSLNQRDGTAELRTLDHVDAICRERFKQGAPLDPGQYAAFLQSAQGFLMACGMRVAFAGPPAELLARLAAPTPSMVPQKGNAGLVVGILGGILLVGILGAALAWFFLRK
ncbi:MAG TPA: hypothetical protein VGG39_25855 [Polyangiaceae bacterium]